MEYREIKGYKYPYRISEEGKITKKLRSGKWISISAHIDRSALRVKLINPDGSRKTVAVKSLMRDLFFGGKRTGMCLTQKNGMISDCSVYNLKWVPRYSVNTTRCNKTRVPVEKIDEQGNVLDVYKSMTEAAAKNYVCISSVSHRCSNKVANPFKTFGFSFRYARG